MLGKMAGSGLDMNGLNFIQRIMWRRGQIRKFVKNNIKIK